MTSLLNGIKIGSSTQMHFGNNSEIMNVFCGRIMGQRYSKTAKVFSSQNFNFRRGTNVILRTTFVRNIKKANYVIWASIVTDSKLLFLSNIFNMSTKS